MCHQCREIDVKIGRYRRLAKGTNDQPMLQHLNALILDLEAEKSGLHPVLRRPVETPQPRHPVVQQQQQPQPDKKEE